MSEQTDSTGLSIFDNAATGGFHVRSRGYDRDQVERYVRKIEDKLNAAIARGDERGQLLEKAEDRITELSAELTSVQARLETAETRLRNVEQPSFAGLGDHVANLLKSAEEQSGKLVATATADAERMRSEAADDADKTRADADAYSTQTRTAADEYSTQTRTAADEYSAQTRTAADSDAASMRQEAKEDATAARVAAVDEAKALLGEVKAAVAQLRADAQKDAASLRAEAERDATQTRAAAERDADEQREAAATLLHDARGRADHEIGAVTETLAAIRHRLDSAGVGGVTAGSPPPASSDVAPVDEPDLDEVEEQTQVIPAAAKAG